MNKKTGKRGKHKGDEIRLQLGMLPTSTFFFSFSFSFLALLFEISFVLSPKKEPSFRCFFTHHQDYLIEMETSLLVCERPNSLVFPLSTSASQSLLFRLRKMYMFSNTWMGPKEFKLSIFEVKIKLLP